MVRKLLQQAEEIGAGIVITLYGALAISASIILYAAVLSRFLVLRVESIRFLESLAYATLFLMLMGLGLVGYGLRRILQDEALRTRMLGGTSTSTISTLAYVACERRYAHLSKISAVMYGLFFAFISGTLVYQPWLRFSEAYLAKVPSVLVIPCCGPTGQVPRFVIYFTEHFGLLLVPLNLLLLFAVSWLVGLNTSLAVFAYRNRPQAVGGKWFCGFGAIVGLFTGCPTCAGLLFMAMLGGVSAVSIVTVLASLQAIFITISIPVLVVTPFLMSRGFSKALATGCTASENERTKQ